jgi:L,D-transpeptidase catalytic domain
MRLASSIIGRALPALAISVAGPAAVVLPAVARAGAGSTATTATTTTPTETTPTTTTPTTTTPTTTTPTTTTPTTTTPTTTTPKHPPTKKKRTNSHPKPPSRATVALYLDREFLVGRHPVTVPRRAVDVIGVVRPYVPGQTVLVREYLNGRPFKQVRLRLKPSRRKVYGGFDWSVASPSDGSVSVTVQHGRTTELSAFSARTAFDALKPSAAFGSTGRFVVLIQQRLAALHFFIPQTGVYDQHTGLAVDAYHRLLGHGASQLLDPATVNDLLNGVGTFAIRFPGQGMHAEGDLSHQLLALADGSTVDWILPISSGKPSTPTVLGSFKIYSRVPGYLPDGMYFSDFFVRGYAIHGYDPAPDYPASHGCMRLPIIDAIPVFNWLNFGDWVDTYYR